MRWKLSLTPKLILLVIATALLAGGLIIAQAQPSSPDSGLSDAERDALYNKLRVEGVGRHKAFVAEFVKDGRDPRKLEQIPLQAEYGSGVPLPSLDLAMEKADIAIRGTVARTAYQFDADGYLYTLVTVDVGQQFKGPAMLSVTIRQSGGPNFSESEDHPYLMVLDGDAPLFVGDTAFLFLEEVDGGLFETQPIVGQYRLENGVISADEGNPFSSAVSGMGAQQFADKIRALSAR